MIELGLPVPESAADSSGGHAGTSEAEFATSETAVGTDPSSGETGPPIVSIITLKPTVRPMSDQTAMEIIARHVGAGDDERGFLPCLRRGEAVPFGKVAELTKALGDLEDELRGAQVVDRRTAHALHRLALESQVLLTDAWPGAFDERVVAAIRTVQEAVERILSGQDIRYYPPPAAPSSEQAALTATTAWPTTGAGGALGDGRSALATIRPVNVDAVCEAVREHVVLGQAIYPQGGKTALDYGDVPARPGVALDTTAVNELIDYPFADMTITVSAGMTLAALRGILEEQHQRLLIDAPAADRATLGGIYATNTSGPRRFGAGRPRDQIIGVSFVTSAGVVVKGGGRVVKNVAGYDFPKLLTGSLGTLGVITQMTLKVRPIPEASALAWVPLWNRMGLAGALDQLNSSGTRPMALDVLNAPASRIAGRGLGMPSGDLIMVIGYEDNARSVRWQLDRLKQELGRSDFAVVEGADAAPLWEALTEFQAAQLGPVTIVANMKPSSVASFLERLDQERWSAQAHAGNGIVRALATGEWALESASAEIDALRRAAIEAGGNLILSRCPTGWKERLRVWGEPRADWAIATRVKAALDPHRALNPGRFVGGI